MSAKQFTIHFVCPKCKTETEIDEILYTDEVTLKVKSDCLFPDNPGTLSHPDKVELNYHPCEVTGEIYDTEHQCHECGWTITSDGPEALITWLRSKDMLVESE